MKTLSKRFLLIIFIIFIFSTNQAHADFEKLTRKSYEEFKNEKGVIVYGVNWGIQWGCAGLENAQLQNLTFTQINSASSGLEIYTIVLNTPAKLLSKDASKSAAIIVNPGEYALTGFDIKVARSSRKVGHIRKGVKDLIEKGKPVGGTFKVNPGEVVYIGDFGLDCRDEPIPWRYYIQKEDFARYVAQFKEKYKFIDGDVIYRLFQTATFGQQP